MKKQFYKIVFCLQISHAGSYLANIIQLRSRRTTHRQ